MARTYIGLGSAMRRAVRRWRDAGCKGLGRERRAQTADSAIVFPGPSRTHAGMPYSRTRTGDGTHVGRCDHTSGPT